MKKYFFLSVFSFLLTFGISAANAGTLPTTVFPNINDSDCTASISTNGWGGECKFRALPMTDGCTLSGKFVGMCGGIYSNGNNACCVPSSSTATGPIAGYSIPEEICEKPTSQGGRGGECKVRALPGSNGCDDATEDFVGTCRTWSSTNADGCCVPKNTTGSGENLSSGMTGTLNYQLLEEIPGQAGISGDFPTYLQRLYRFTFWAIGVAALFMLTVGGFMYVTAAGNTSRISTAKTIITDSLLGIVVALFAWLFLYIINPDLVESLTLPNTASTPVPGGSTPATPIPGLVSASCTDPTAMKASLNSGGTVCSNTCQRGRCTFDDRVLSAIDQVSQEAGVDKRIIKAIICQESGGNITAHASDGGCGLMQITNSAWAGTATCPSDILNPVTNIRQGIALYKGKLSAVSGLVYDGGINAQHMTFAAYNCCANGENPNTPSVSCTTNDGWARLPKWACPINPGTGTFNMCKVKNYACDVAACANLY